MAKRNKDRDRLNRVEAREEGGELVASTQANYGREGRRTHDLIDDGWRTLERMD